MWRDAETLFGPGDRTADVIGTVNVAFSGGSSSIAAAAANYVYILLTRVDLQAGIRAGAEAARSNLVEEALRLYGPTVLRPRVAKRDTQLGGVDIEKGALVILVAGAANLDEARYDHADEVDLDRRAPRDHFTFHAGPRACPGQGLARLQLGTVLSVLVERLVDLRRDPDTEPPRYQDHFRRQWRPLHALFEAS